MMLIKHKLSATIVLTSILGYLIMSGSNVSFYDLLLLITGGFLVTGAANTINEVLEKEYDALMKRTANRPLAAGRMSTSEAVLFSGFSCLIGVTLLSIFNPITGILGMASFLIYSFIYTPLKRIGSISVAIGAIPGALPLLIGCTAYEGRISSLAISLFAIQFLWQFPHFLSIGYLGFNDYKKAGYKLIPEVDGQIETKIGLHAFIYACLILLLTIVMFVTGLTSGVALIINSFLAIAFAYYAYRFYKSFDSSSARKLMFSSFMFMPFYLLTCLFF